MQVAYILRKDFHSSSSLISFSTVSYTAELYHQRFLPFFFSQQLGQATVTGLV